MSKVDAVSGSAQSNSPRLLDSLADFLGYNQPVVFSHNGRSEPVGTNGLLTYPYIYLHRTSICNSRSCAPWPVSLFFTPFAVLQ